MFNIFKKFNCDKRLLQLELDIEHQQKQIDELRNLLLALSTSLNEVQTQLNYHIDKIGKSI
jgi:uncharacterized coiled-coil protein SlyX